MEKELVCPLCNNTFIANSPRRVYCSIQCCRKSQQNKQWSRINKDTRYKYNHKGYLANTIIYMYEGKCALCNWRATEELITVNGRLQKAYGNEVHHIVAVADGGDSSLDNLILLCPNHHKQANLGIITKEELRKHLKREATPEEKQAMSNKSVDRVTNAVMDIINS